MTGLPGAGARTVVEVHADPHGVRATCRTATGALAARVLRSDDRGAHVALVANRALLLAGDHVTIDVVVGPGAWLEIEEVTGTVAYDASGVPSSWSVGARVGAGGTLVWDAPPFVVATGAHVERRTDVMLAAGAVAAWREALVLGRTGEAGGFVRSATRVTQEGAPVLVDDVVLGDPWSDLVTRGDARVLDTVAVVGLRPAEPLQAEPADGVTVLELAGPGAVARDLRAHTHDPALDERWAAWRGEAGAARHTGV
ncbi:urease accessory protein UreD [Cellulomonas sp. C5510]|uniref:urease accessory protein UreD n=1 Tax=Cellulomonas sp. C5510 TaxID=2871170 RepID=UPI001C943B77|nr:urease accessory protein UreD [Cellulomonas sp. C5510]QZN87001.1 urease accessory protein UreD [Cellulomonas sp. C5510]